MSAALIAKIIVISTLVIIVFSLASALYSMVKDKGQSDRTVKALTLRIGLSMLLLAFVMLSGKFGLLTPSAMP